MKNNISYIAYYILNTFLFSFFIFQFSKAENNISHYEDLLKQANELYSLGKYDSAIINYETIVQAEYESAGLYYNLANAYYKTKHIPSAILYYEKAKKLAPDDNDVLFNLQLANQQITDKIEPLPELFFTRWWKQIIFSTSLESWAEWTIILSFYSVLMLVFFLLSSTVWLRKMYFWSGVAGLLLMSLTFSFAMKQENYISGSDAAIVFSSSVTAKSSPDETSTNLFVIHEGTKVKILETVNEWFKISLADGSIGWMKNEEVKVI